MAKFAANCGKKPQTFQMQSYVPPRVIYQADRPKLTAEFRRFLSRNQLPEAILQVHLAFE
jgi:hypothetical protein